MPWCVPHLFDYRTVFFFFFFFFCFCLFDFFLFPRLTGKKEKHHKTEINQAGFFFFFNSGIF